MNCSTAPMQNLAELLVELEREENDPVAHATAADFSVCEKLRLHFINLMGSGGFSALLSRSLTMAAADVPWLKVFWVEANGALHAAEAERRRLGPEEMAVGEVAILSHLLGLLVAFMGEDLTVRVLSAVWPKVALHPASTATVEHENL